MTFAAPRTPCRREYRSNRFPTTRPRPMPVRIRTGSRCRPPVHSGWRRLRNRPVGPDCTGLLRKDQSQAASLCSGSELGWWSHPRWRVSDEPPRSVTLIDFYCCTALAFALVKSSGNEVQCIYLTDFPLFDSRIAVIALACPDDYHSHQDSSEGAAASFPILL
jgi:hypothetical protein